MGCGASSTTATTAGVKTAVEEEDLAVYSKYEFEDKISTTSTSQIYEATAKEDNQQYAIKCIVKDFAQSDGRSRANICEEAGFMKRLDHPNICNLCEVFEDQYIIYFVIELCSGELFEMLEETILLQEADAVRISSDMVSAVAHVHENGIIHRDLKPESWLLSGATLRSTVKLVNFSLAVAGDENTELAEPSGTLHYVAPEVLRGRYGNKSDVWALGVVLFLMVYATYPFDGQGTQEVIKAILGSEPLWENSCYDLSSNAKDFLKRMLEKDPAIRLSAKAAMNHGWITGDKAPESKKNLPRMSVLGLSNTALSGIGDLSGGLHSQGNGPALKGAGRRPSCLVTTQTTKLARDLPGPNTGLGGAAFSIAEDD